MAAHRSLRFTRSELLLRAAAGLAGAVAAGRLGGRLLEDSGLATVDPRPQLVVRDLAIGGAARRVAAATGARFNLLGIHWRGPGTVRFRVADAGGQPGPWQRVHEHELPDGPERRDDGWRIGTPVWTGGSTGFEVRVDGPVDALRAHEIWSPVAPISRRLAAASQPLVLPRSAWAADESIVRAEPAYADRLRFAVVHHTAGKNPASPDESAAVVRAIQTYHVESNGWNDIGYNFLVDGFGQIFEGRGGGIDRNVVGAHALGYNTGSVGVAVLGNFEQETPTADVQAALVRLLAWRLDLGHVDPVALVAATATSGEVRTIRAISGHRDVGSTACPGATLYPLLDGLALQVAALGLPKLYDPEALVASDRTVRFTARLSQDLPWTLSVVDPAGSETARAGGGGTVVDWTWDATTSPDGTYTWQIDVPGVTAAAGRVVVGAAAGPAAPVVTPPPKPARPPGVPRRIPKWAWELRRWHRTPRAARGKRPPGTPRRPPAWYWKWFAWVNAVERWQRDWGG